MTMKRSILTVSLLGALGACTVSSGSGDPDPEPTAGADAAPAAPPDAAKPIGDVESYCNEWVGIVCRQLFACYTQEERDNVGVPPTEAECAASSGEDCAMASSADVCQGFGLEGTFQVDQAEPCVMEFGAFTCEQFRDPDTATVLATYAPSCVAMCQ
jgi:hypothetical protein